MTKIEWAEKSWNPVTGCTPISAGCANCYAKRRAETRLRGRYGYPADEPFQVTLHPDKLNKPLHWRKPARIFVCSMGDLFHEDVEWNFIYKVFEMAIAAKQHQYLILTKRANRMAKVIPEIWFHLERNYKGYNIDIPLKNVWLGVSCENQKAADERIPLLLQIPAAVRFVSFEPLLEDIYTSQIPRPECFHIQPYGWEKWLNKKLHWAIIGCESGPKRRPCPVKRVENIVNECQDAQVPVFVKQLDLNGKVEHDISKFPLSLQVREYPEVKDDR